MPTGSTAVISQRVTHRAIGGRAAPLRQNAVLPAEAHDVPDDQEVAGQVELFDERQLALDLPPGALVIGLVAAARAFIHALAQEATSGFALRHGVARKLVAQIGQRELQARGNFQRVGDGLGQIGEQARHFGGRFDVALGVALQQPAGRRPAWSCGARR